MKKETHMDLKQLHYFLAIVEEEQITAAARKLHIAQPPLSHQMKLLEEELQVKLFERGPHRIRLTEAGTVLARHARTLLEQADTARRAVADCRAGLRGTLTLGMVSSSGGLLLQPAMQTFCRTHPDVHFAIHDANTYQLIEMLDSGRIDLGIVRTPFRNSRFHCRYLAPEPMTASMTKALDWCPERQTIDLAELSGRPLILYRRFQQLLEDAFAASAITPNIYCLNDDARTSILWANAGLGIAITPASAVPLADHAHLHVKTINDTALHTRLACIWRKDRALSQLASNFLQAFS